MQEVIVGCFGVDFKDIDQFPPGFGFKVGGCLPYHGYGESFEKFLRRSQCFLFGAREGPGITADFFTVVAHNQYYLCAPKPIAIVLPHDGTDRQEVFCLDGAGIQMFHLMRTLPPGSASYIKVHPTIRLAAKWLGEYLGINPHTNPVGVGVKPEPEPINGHEVKIAVPNLVAV